MRNIIFTIEDWVYDLQQKLNKKCGIYNKYDYTNSVLLKHRYLQEKIKLEDAKKNHKFKYFICYPLMNFILKITVGIPSLLEHHIKRILTPKYHKLKIRTLYGSKQYELGTEILHATFQLFENGMIRNIKSELSDPELKAFKKLSRKKQLKFTIKHLYKADMTTIGEPLNLFFKNIEYLLTWWSTRTETRKAQHRLLDVIEGSYGLSILAEQNDVKIDEIFEALFSLDYEVEQRNLLAITQQRTNLFF